MNPINLGHNLSGLRVAAADEIAFVCKVQKQHSGALGFLPRGAIDVYVAAGRVLIGEQNGDEAGYILGRQGMRYDQRIAPITQCAVDMSAQRRTLGMQMVEAWVTGAFLDGRGCVQCWCADDIDAQHFWPACGFTPIARRWPQNSRCRSLTLWRRSTSTAALQDEFKRLPPLAGFKASKVGRIEIIGEGGTSPLTQASQQMLLFDLLADDGRLCFIK